MGEKARQPCRSLVLPLHGHLAPAAWAAAQAGARARGRLRADRRAGRCRARSPATSPSCASAACSAATSPPRPPTAASTRRLEHARRPRRRRAARLGRRSWSVPARDHRLRHRVRPRRHGRPRQRPRGALPRPADACSPRASPPPTRASATCAQPPHPHRPRTAPRTGRRRRPRGRATRRIAARELETAAEHAIACARPPPTSTATPPQACRPHDGPLLQRGPALLRRPARRGPPARRRPSSPTRSASAWSLARQGLEARRGEHPSMAIAVKPALPAAAAPPGADARFEGLVLDFLSYLELERGLSRNTLNAYRTDLLQYGEYLAAHDVDALTARPADIAEFLAELATGKGRPACSASTIHRKAACLRSFYKHLRRDELIGDDPTAALSAPRRAKKLPQVLNYAEVQKLLAVAARRRADRAARPGAARGDVRVRAAGLGDDRARARRHRPARGLPARPRQGLEGTAGAARPQGDRGDHRLPARRPAEAGRRTPRGEALRQLPRRAADPPGPLQDRPAPRPRRPASPAR